MASIAVVIPCYRVRPHICRLIGAIGPEVDAIYVVDDACPEASGRLVEDTVTDPRVVVLYNPRNLGVGGATLAGMARAVTDGADVVVKLDGDGQMDPALIPNFTDIVLMGEADYAKGNRFFETDTLSAMPLGRLIGNAGLSFLSKLSTGYWQTFDPTNGYFAVHASLVSLLPVHKIHSRYFFESDLLFRLSILRAKVVDIPMHAYYGAEVSGMKPHREIWRFARAHIKNFCKRVFYNYLIRNFSVASLELLFGIVLVGFGVIFGVANWGSDAPSTAGTVMLAALPVIIGTQMLLAFINFDVQSVPTSTLHLRLKASRRPMTALRQWKGGADADGAASATNVDAAKRSRAG